MGTIHAYCTIFFAKHIDMLILDVGYGNIKYKWLSIETIDTLFIVTVCKPST